MTTPDTTPDPAPAKSSRSKPSKARTTTKAKPKDTKPKELIGSLVHGLNIIRAFDKANPEMTMTQVAEKTGMDRAGARRYLLTLADLGYVHQDGRIFRLTPKVMELGYAYLSSVPLAEKAQYFLNRIRDRSGFPVALAIRDEDFIVHIGSANTDEFHSPALTIGRRFRLAYSSAGRCILAHSSEEELDRTLARIDMTPASELSITTEAELRAELARIRSQGYALVDQEMQMGIRSLALPVFNARAEIVGSINTYTFAGVTSIDEMMDGALPEMKLGAEELTRTLT
ncbi:IclR family transcriptional regulator domain-containing protein [Marinibacterium sp. SX1]|uniref:IclR family transcriptional regulator domain-containing protein n=1 Tax=Marinibacterium sp. SX1 TaxID=3388424 RepID=UPI003D164EC5